MVDAGTGQAGIQGRLEMGQNSRRVLPVKVQGAGTLHTRRTHTKKNSYPQTHNIHGPDSSMTLVKKTHHHHQ